MNKLESSTEKQVVKMYKYMLTREQIADVLQINRGTVTEVLKRNLTALEFTELKRQHRIRTAEAYTNPEEGLAFVNEYLSSERPYFKDLCQKYKVSLSKGRNYLKKYLTEEQRKEQHSLRVAQARFVRNGATGKHSANYKGICLDSEGYASVHTTAIDEETSRARLNRKVFAEALGLDVHQLPMNMDVHHIDTNRLNNSLDNLALCTKQAHAELHRQLRRLRKYMTSK